jgi:hypothetical protein
MTYIGRIRLLNALAKLVKIRGVPGTLVIKYKKTCDPATRAGMFSLYSRLSLLRNDFPFLIISNFQ